MDIIPSISIFLESSIYALFFVGAFFEGPVMMLAGGLLWRLGQVDFLPAYVALLAGDITADAAWYYVGHHGARHFVARLGWLFGLTADMIDKAERRFHTYHTRVLVISKLTMGFGLAVPILIVAGMLRVPFGRYLMINIMGGFVWTAFVMWIGYNFGNILANLSQDIQLAIGAGLVVTFYILVRILSEKLKNSNW